MKHVAIYGKSFTDRFTPFIQQLFNTLADQDMKVHIFEGFIPFLQRRVELPEDIQVFDRKNKLSEDIDCLFSIGGDGTLLDSVQLIGNSEIPVLGINTGRLGFLANIAKEEIMDALEELFTGNYKLDKRTLLEVNSANDDFHPNNFALNELAIHKKDTSSMITIHTYIDDHLLNSYWCDGLIVATPTGSTAYSLSCGGPIIVPGSKNLVITPIAPHNLTVRPLILPDEAKLTFRVEGRSDSFLASLDSKSFTIDVNTTIHLKKTTFKVNLIQLQNQDFFTTIRNKLMWGIDRRN